MGHNPDEEYLTKLLHYVNDTRQLFSNKMKRERERMVCRAFLRCAGLPFAEEQIIISGDEPPDVIFESARFEIRELLDERRKRGDEWAQEAKRVEKAKDIEGVLRPAPSPKQITLEELIPLVADALRDKAMRYGNECRHLDALVYVNLHETFLAPSSTVVGVEALEAHGWRSVSIVFIPFVVVLATTSTAPGFLCARVGQIVNAWPYPEGWFEP
jgi:hypothetical protein